MRHASRSQRDENAEINEYYRINDGYLLTIYTI